MPEIIIAEDSGNAPKKQVVRDFHVALVNRDIGAAMDLLRDDTHLEVIGYKTADGKAAIRALIEEDMKRPKTTALAIDTIISHGKQCAASGTFRFEDGGVVAFCNMYTFDNFSKDAKLQQITIYSVVLP
jgi:hypothetical protein